MESLKKKKKKKIVKERCLGTVYNYNYNVAIAFSGVNGELVPRFFFLFFYEKVEFIQTEIGIQQGKLQSKKHL